MTLEEVRDRMKAARVEIDENRLEVVRRLLTDALRPIHAMDSRATVRSSPPSRSIPCAREATMASEELFYATIRDVGARLRRRALSPVELTARTLERIEKLDPKLHAFVTVTADRALADARAAETALGARRISSPLLGIPSRYKDIYATRGILTTGGSALLADWVPDEDSTWWRALQQAGGVMLGKLITHEFAFGIQFPGHRFPPRAIRGTSSTFPAARSSGSGAALAAGMAVGRRSARTPAARSAGPRRSAASPGSSRRTGAAAAPG